VKTLHSTLAFWLLVGSYFVNAQAALDQIDSLKKVVDRAADDTIKIRAYHQLALAYPDDQFEQSVDAEQKSLAIAEKTESEKYLVYALTNLGALHRRHSNYIDAISYLRRALATAESEDAATLINTYLELGIACLRMTKLDSATYFLDKGTTLAIASKNQKMEAAFYNMTGNVLKERRSFKEAIEFYLKATALFEKIKDDGGLTQSLSNVGNLENLMGNYEKAEEYALQSLRIAEKINQRSSIAYSNRLLGRIYRRQKKFDEAAKVYEIAIGIYRELDAKRDLAETILAKGNIFFEKNDFKNAIQEYRRALRTNKLLSDSTNMAYTYAALGSASFELKQPQQAIRYFDSTRTVAKRIGLAMLEADGYDGLSTVYASIGNYKLAHESHIKYTTLRDSLSQIENKEAAAELEAQYQNEKKENEIRALNAENEVKELQLQKQTSQRNYLIGFIILSLLLIAVLYNRYIIKQKASKKLEELDEIKSRFFANISHEFRTPLSLIIGPLQQKIESASTQKEKEDLELMKRNAERLHNLIDQLLDLSKIESGSMKLHAEEGDLSNFIKVIYASFSSMAEQKKIDYQLYADEGTIDGFYDRDKLEKILFNLLSNAFKFTPNQGRISLSISKENNHAIIVVKDSGAGIPSDKLASIFERFYQVDDSATRAAGGTGVGLALSKELAEVHHGKLSASSAEGKGCEFKLVIPLSREFYKNEIATARSSDSVVQPSRYSVAERYPEELSDQLPVVMIAEDNEDMRSFIGDTLKTQFAVVSAEDGIEAFEKIVTQVPDLVITDWMMPRMDGNALCEKLKTHPATSHIPIIMLTAKADQQSKLAGLETGADDYLTKPFDARELRIRVNNLVEQRKKLREIYRQQITLHPKEVSIKSPDAVFLEKVLALLEANHNNALFGVEEFTSEIGLSRMQLYRKLKALTGSSPGDFLRQFRLEKAKQLLRLPGIQVSEVAYQTGFNNLSNFTKAFKEFTGLTPSEFK
jgi:signal transduction histidine kinase/AraC-like DNA-binding protein/tetratricopeptide (TPR) repeat protein